MVALTLELEATDANTLLNLARLRDQDVEPFAADLLVRATRREAHLSGRRERLVRVHQHVLKQGMPVGSQAKATLARQFGVTERTLYRDLAEIERRLMRDRRQPA